MKIPIRYHIQIRVQESHLDELQHVNNVEYFHFLQEVAIAHWNAIAPKEAIEELRWVVRKHLIEYLKPAHLHDELTVETWVEEFSSVTSLRKYQIRRDKDVLVNAETLWIALDTKTMKPKRVDKTIASLFFE